MNKCWIVVIDFLYDRYNISLIYIITGNIQDIVYAAVFISSVIGKRQSSYHQHPAFRSAVLFSGRTVHRHDRCCHGLVAGLGLVAGTRLAFLAAVRRGDSALPAELPFGTHHGVHHRAAGADVGPGPGAHGAAWHPARLPFPGSP